MTSACDCICFLPVHTQAGVLLWCYQRNWMSSVPVVELPLLCGLVFEALSVFLNASSKTSVESMEG